MKAKREAAPITRERLLARAQSRFRSISIHAQVDREDGYDDAPGGWFVRAIDRDGQVAHATRSTLADALRAVLGEDESKECYQCLVEKPPGMFALDAGRADGRCQRCKTCERVRRAEGRRAARGGFDAEDGAA